MDLASSLTVMLSFFKDPSNGGEMIRHLMNQFRESKHFQIRFSFFRNSVGEQFGWLVAALFLK